MRIWYVPLVCGLSALALLSVPAQASVPQFGAQVWIEPGQTPAEIDGWFATLQSSHIPVARLFLMWSYLEPGADQWDWSLYDAAFRSAEHHHVAIVATLTPSGPPAWMGPEVGGNDSQGIGVNSTEAQREAASIYIEKVVTRYRSSAALDTWLLLNEPGQQPSSTELANAAFAPWLQRQYPDIAAVNRAWGTNYSSFIQVSGQPKHNGWNPNSEIDWATYWRSFQTSQLAWIAAEVRKHDSKHPLHLNPHALLSNIASWSDDLSAWREFLDSLGCSIHPAWHFGLLPRDQFALGVSYINDLVDGAIAPKPHWVTELQGGNNISSGGRPMEPTPEDTAQWLWTSVGAGAQRTIFWLLNSRSEGQEAGEWSLLDFNQKPSQRLKVATSIATTLEQQAGFFANAKPAVPDITLLLSLDALTYQLSFAADDDVARGRDQHLTELLGFYKALSQIGPPPHVKLIDDYDWDRPGINRVLIVPDARVLTRPQIERLNRFARSGGTLLLTGLSGLYDRYGKIWALDPEQPLSEVTGARFKEVHLLGKEISVPLPSGPLPSRMWMTSIEVENSAETSAIATNDGDTIATERQLPGRGRVIWIPSPIGIGAWTANLEPLAKYLKQSLAETYKTVPFTLQANGSSCVLRVMRSADAYLTILTNGSDLAASCSVLPGSHARRSRIWPVTPGNSTIATTLAARETVVDMWQ